MGIVITQFCLVETIMKTLTKDVPERLRKQFRKEGCDKGLINA
jgi:hypothetical protein